MVSVRNSFIQLDFRIFLGFTGEVMVQKVNICEVLLKVGASVNVLDKWYRTFLYYCVSSNFGNVDVSIIMEEFFLENKVDFFLKCYLGRLSLYYVFDKVDM